MKRRVACTVMTTLAVGLVSCGGSSPSKPSPASPITRGLLLISQTSDGIVSLSPRLGMIRISVPVEVKAMNDIPLTLNHARLTLYRSGVELQRSEVTANDIIAQAGSNYVTRDRTLAFTLVFDYTPQEMDSFDAPLGHGRQRQHRRKHLDQPRVRAASRAGVAVRR